MDHLLECRGIGYEIGAEVLLEEIDLTLSPGDEVVIFSEQQQAASSLLQICSTLIRPTKGKLIIEGREVDYDNGEELLKLKRRLAFVDKKSTLIQNLTLLENLALANIYHENRSLEETEDELDPLIELMDLREVLHLRPAEVDPAVKSRALYAIEAAKDPVVAIFDQPENDYSENDRHYLFSMLNRLKQDGNAGFLIHSRSSYLIEQWGETFVLLKGGVAMPPVTRDSFLRSWKQDTGHQLQGEEEKREHGS